VVFPCEQSLKSLPGYSVGLAFNLAFFTDLRVVHGCTMEEVGVGWSGCRT
jgi:hypothetical protein